MSGYWKIPVTVSLRAPWVVPGDSNPGPETDIFLVKNNAGTYILPATLIKGVLRGALAEIAASNCEGAKNCEGVLQRGFGRKSDGGEGQGGSNAPARGFLYFEDLALQPDEARKGKTDPRTQRVEIDPRLGAAKEGNLLFVECPFEFGTEVSFFGHIHIMSQDHTRVTEALRLAVSRIFALGGMKSVGFGRVESFEVGNPEAVIFATANESGTSFTLRYTLDRPFLVDSKRQSGNLMVGSDIISGGVIKGALAHAMEQAGVCDEDTGSFLSALHIGHAHPAVPGESARRELPLSLSESDGKLYCNLARDIDIGLHSFLPNWKNKTLEKVRAKFAERGSVMGANPMPRTVGRSRTAINTETLGALYEEDAGGALFSQISVEPHKHEWVGALHAPAGKSDDLNRVLSWFKTGLPGVGKTNAVMTATWSPLTESKTPTGEINLCLQTNACILAPDDANNIGEGYATYFEKLGFTLHRFFAQQQLRGGYQALRYPVDSAGYRPWLLTSPGSVFRIKVADENARQVSDILKHGLPPAEHYSKDWREFPFLRENGFGAVSVNAVDHSALSQGVSL